MLLTEVAIRLNKLDLPTFVLPTITTVARSFMEHILLSIDEQRQENAAKSLPL